MAYPVACQLRSDRYVGRSTYSVVGGGCLQSLELLDIHTCVPDSRCWSCEMWCDAVSLEQTRPACVGRSSTLTIAQEERNRYRKLFRPRCDECFDLLRPMRCSSICWWLPRFNVRLFLGCGVGRSSGTALHMVVLLLNSPSSLLLFDFGSSLEVTALSGSCVA